MGRQPGFFDIDERLTRLSDLGDQLEGFRAAVDFEMFRDALDQALAYADGVQGGRPPIGGLAKPVTLRQKALGAFSAGENAHHTPSVP